MRDDQLTFLHRALDVGALQFGEFVLKSGRRSPYFFDTGRFNRGLGLLHLGRAYAQAIIDSEIGFDMLYGPAYKGIPLVTATCLAFAEYHNIDLPYAFNRKEAKDHGEGGIIVGSPVQGRVLILDDVISAGTSVRESIAIIRAHGAVPIGVAIALDRQERVDDFGIPIISILKFAHLVNYLTQMSAHTQDLQRMQIYQSQYIDTLRDL